jgi:hypothetical protein
MKKYGFALKTFGSDTMLNYQVLQNLKLIGRDEI